MAMVYISSEEGKKRPTLRIEIFASPKQKEKEYMQAIEEKIEKRGGKCNRAEYLEYSPRPTTLCLKFNNWENLRNFEEDLKQYKASLA